MMRRTIERAAKASERRAARAARGIVMRWLVIALGGAVVMVALTMLVRSVARRRSAPNAGPAPDAFGAGVRAVDEELDIEPEEAMPTDSEPSWPGHAGAAG